MANGKSAAAGAIEGFLGGFERGTGLRRQRTSDKLALEDRQRRLVAEELQRGRQRVQDEQAAAEAARARARFQDETGLAAGPAPVDTLGDPVSGIGTTGGDFNPSDYPSGIQLGKIGPSTYGAGPVPEDVDQLRRAVGEDLRAGAIPQAAPGAAPVPGFYKVGLSEDERELERVTALRTMVSAYLTATEEEKAVMEQDPDMIGALQEFGQLTGVMSRRAAAAQPVSPSPLQLLTGGGGLMSTFDPRGVPGERVQPLLGPGGDQFRGRVPDDNFARTAAVSAANAIARIDRDDFYGDEEAVEAEAELIAMRFGFVDVAHVQRVLTAAVGVGETEARATELREQGFSDDEVIARLKDEGLIDDG